MAQLQIILSERMKMILMRTVMTMAMMMMMSMEMAMMRLKRCGELHVVCIGQTPLLNTDQLQKTKQGGQTFTKSKRVMMITLNNKVIGTVSF